MIKKIAPVLALLSLAIEVLPLSIGTGSTRLAGRFTANLQTSRGWYVNGSTAYTWRSDTTLDRPYYFTDDEFVMSDRVDMPNVFDYVLNLGFMKNGLNTNFAFSQQQTLGGGDIRRQDMPFVSNRMNFTELGGMVMAPVPKLGEHHPVRANRRRRFLGVLDRKRHSFLRHTRASVERSRGCQIKPRVASRWCRCSFRMWSAIRSPVLSGT